VITRIPASYPATKAPHFSDGTTLACRYGYTPWPMREALAWPKTRNQSDTPGKAGGLMSGTASKAVDLAT